MSQLPIHTSSVNDIVDPQNPDGDKDFVIMTEEDFAKLPWHVRWPARAVAWWERVLCALLGLETPTERSLRMILSARAIRDSLQRVLDEGSVRWTDAELERLELFAKFSEDPQLQGLVRQTKAAVRALQHSHQTHSDLVDQRDAIIDELCAAAGDALTKANPMGEEWRTTEFRRLASVVRRYG